MRMKLYTLLCISFFLLFTACNQDDDPVPPEAGSKNCACLYCSGNNSLSSFAKEDVEEMIAGMELVDSSSSNLLVYQDGGSAPVLFRSQGKEGYRERDY